MVREKAVVVWLVGSEMIEEKGKKKKRKERKKKIMGFTVLEKIKILRFKSERGGVFREVIFVNFFN